MSLIVETKNLYKSFKTAQYYIPVIRGINLKINKGETLGIVGESGCGKTTLGKLIAGLDTSYIGEIYFNKFPLNLYLKEKFIRSKIQMVFQHPALSLNRRMKIYDTLKDPLKLILQLNSNEIDYRINDILPLKQDKFENCDVYVPNNYKRCLAQEYGMKVFKPFFKEWKFIGGKWIK